MRRVDIVGMGCNAAVNALQAATAMATARPGRYGVLVCLEVCSAAYARNRKMSTAVVNSLFGDGCGALLIQAALPGVAESPSTPVILDFEPFILTDAIDAMKFELEDGRLSFFLDKDIPNVIGRHVTIPVERLLARHGLDKTAVRHWLVHSGGKKVIDAIERQLGLPADALRHTRAVLRDYGNLSSASVLFALQRLADEGIAQQADLGVLIAMGPGTSIETALLRW
jgi:predicted naringenin-chalcone synthase